MIQQGGTIKIQIKNKKFVFGKSNKSGKAEEKVLMELLGNKFSNDQNLVIEYITKKKADSKINLKILSEAIHNYQYASKETSDFVKQFKSLDKLKRERVLDAIRQRNIKRDKDCKQYNKECASHRDLVNIGEIQLEKLTRMHDFMSLDKRSKLHKWTDPTQKFSQKQKNRLSKKEKKELKKHYRKSRKVKNNKNNTK